MQILKELEEAEDLEVGLSPWNLTRFSSTSETRKELLFSKKEGVGHQETGKEWENKQSAEVMLPGDIDSGGGKKVLKRILQT